MGFILKWWTKVMEQRASPLPFEGHVTGSTIAKLGLYYSCWWCCAGARWTQSLALGRTAVEFNMVGSSWDIFGHLTLPCSHLAIATVCYLYAIHLHNPAYLWKKYYISWPWKEQWGYYYVIILVPEKHYFISLRSKKRISISADFLVINN